MDGWKVSGGERRWIDGDGQSESEGWKGDGVLG